ncbi:MAG: YCF48-related protein, partial [Chromatocurvus sp.]
MQRACVAGVLLLAVHLSFAGDGEDLVFTPAPQMREPSKEQLLDIADAGSRLVAVGTSGLIITSDDSGVSWKQADVPVSATLTAVSFPVPDMGWAVGHAGVILHTRNRGDSWELQFDGKRAGAAFLEYARSRRAALEATVDALDAGTDNAAAGDSGQREDLEYALDDAMFIEEEAQLAVDTGPADPFLDVQFFDERSGLAVGAYGMSFRTEDGGTSWVVNQDGIDNPDRFHLYSLFLDEQEGVYIAGEAGLLYRSTDAGLTFERFEDVYEGSLFGVLPLGRGVLTFGLRGHLFYSAAENDGWESLTSENTSSLYGGTDLDDGGALLLGAGG